MYIAAVILQEKRIVLQKESSRPRGAAATPLPPIPSRCRPRSAALMPPHRPRPHRGGPAAPPSLTCRGGPTTPPSSTCRGGPAVPPSSTCRGGPAAPPSSTWPEHPHSRHRLHPLRRPPPPCEGCLHRPCQGW
jgi:hypothetical protein